MTPLHLVLGNPRRAIIAQILSLLSGVALLAVSGWLITRAAQQPPIMYLQMAIVGVRAFALARAFFRYIGRLSAHDNAFRGLARVRRWAMERLVPLGPDGLIRTGRGSVQSAIVRDVDALQDYPLRVVEPLWAHGLTIVVAVIAISTVSPFAALATAALCGVVAWIAIRIESGTSARYAERSAQTTADIADIVDIVVGQLDVLDAFELRDAFRTRVELHDKFIVEFAARRALFQAWTASRWALVGSVLALGFAIIHDVADAPLFTAIVLVPLALNDVVAAIPGIVDSRRQVIAAASHLDEIFPESVPPEIPTNPESVSDLSRVSDIEVANLGASYPQMNRPTISGVNFHASIGDVVLVSGRSGSGKSTLAHVLVRFLNHTGRYALNGIDVHELSPDSVRRRVGLCEQRPHLFATTLRHNLDFARDGATDQELLSVLDRVQLSEWVKARGGLDMDLGERAELLSGGQAHRIALARNLLADRDVIILDEPTASLDRATADALIDDFTAATSDRILVVISHDAIAVSRRTVRVTL